MPTKERRIAIALILASSLLAAAEARAQRLANGRPARGSPHYSSRAGVHEVADKPAASEPAEDAGDVQAEVIPPPASKSLSEKPAAADKQDASAGDDAAHDDVAKNDTANDNVANDDAAKLEVVAPADPRKDPGPETDCDDRFHFGLGKGLGLGLGRWCRPGFGFAGLRSAMPQPEPLSGASWLNRPLHVDAFSGVIYGGPLIEDNIRRQGDMFSGFRLGWDWTRRLGGEMRFGFAQVGTEDIPTGIELDDADVVYWDLNVLWYPTGDTRLRPYLSIGLGALHVDFVDAAGNGHQKELIGVPIAAGLKYRATPWCAVRADIADNLAFPYADVEAQGNISITVSAEFHFGGQRTSYWPWNPTLQSW